MEDREHFQQRLIGLNPEWNHAIPSLGHGGIGTDVPSSSDKVVIHPSVLASAPRPDGDADVNFDFSESPPSLSFCFHADVIFVALFNVPDCLACSGIVKPSVVFFGENVPPDTVAHAKQIVAFSDGLLAVGSSLQVYSAFRYVHAIYLLLWSHCMLSTHSHIDFLCWQLSTTSRLRY